MAVQRTYYGTQGEKFYTPIDTDKIVLAQTDPTGLKGYRTVTSTIDVVAQTVFDIIKSQGGLINGDGESIIGLGTVADPIRVNLDYLKNKWVLGSIANISQIGDINDFILPVTAISAWVLRFGAIPVFLAGRNVTFPAQDVDVRTLASTSNDGYIYLYFRIVLGELRLIGRNAPIADQYGTAYIGRVRVSLAAGGINDVVCNSFIRIGTYRISQTPQGGAIPATTGAPFDVTYTWWGGEGSMRIIRAGIRTNYVEDGAFWNSSTREMIINTYGQFYIQNKQLAIDSLGDFKHVFVENTISQARCYINGNLVFSGPGSSTTPVNINNYLNEGWNVVKCEWGSMRIKGPVY